MYKIVSEPCILKECVLKKVCVCIEEKQSKKERGFETEGETCAFIINVSASCEFGVEDNHAQA